MTLEDCPPSRWGALLIGLMMVLVPAMGVPSDEMLQDTFKSAVAAILTLATAMAFFWLRRARPKPLVWHGALWLPLLLAAFAAGSMLWSHTYLGGVEMVRWLLFALLLGLGSNLRPDYFEARIVPGIHWGISIASVWTALQFWSNFPLFPQGPIPASTFINRNFFAEYAICALPFSLYLLLRARDFRVALGLAAIIGFNVVALMMTGTRSALLGLILLCMVAPWVYLRCRRQFEVRTWSHLQKLLITTVFIGTVAALGAMPSKNTKLIADYGEMTALSRAAKRTASIARNSEYTENSFSVRLVMWSATLRMIAHNPLTGVGAGAWEVDVPLYQSVGSQLETDFYAHNEYLQMVAEYGLVGWLFLAFLLSYCGYSARQFWADRSETGLRIAPLRGLALCSLLMLLVVSNAGFPWRLASTGALFALSLSLLALCDAQGKVRRYLMVGHIVCKNGCNRVALLLATLCMGLALYVTQRAAECESSLIRGVRMALTIAASGSPEDPNWDKAKVESLRLLRRGIALNGHYRKITPIAGDVFAQQGDWENALWIWESIYRSRPHVVAIITNIARANIELGRFDEARKYVAKAQEVQPAADAVRALDAVLLFREGQDKEASQRIKTLLADNVVDYDLVRAAYLLGKRMADSALTIQALEARKRYWPSEAVDSWLKLGDIYHSDPKVRDDAHALAAYRSAMAASPGRSKQETLRNIPPEYRDRL